VCVCGFLHWLKSCVRPITNQYFLGPTKFILFTLLLKQLGESEMTSEKKKLHIERKKNCEKEEERGYQRKRGQESKEVRDK
jgi:hypothetical protein